MRAFEAILFDLGGTLLYFDGSWPEILQQRNHILVSSLQKAGLEIEPITFLSELQARIRAYAEASGPDFIEYTTEYILRSLLGESGYPDLDRAVLRSALEAQNRISQEHWQVEDDTLVTLQALKQEGYRLAIISNAGDDRDVQVLIDKAGIRPFFDIIVTSAAQGIRKPNPKLFWRVLEKLGVEPKRSAMVGDTLGADILGAGNAGIFSIWITRRADFPANRAHADTIHPDSQISTLSELPDLISSVNLEKYR
jgi:HAD superfamily hydrolase (TIGR01662 family)